MVTFRVTHELYQDLQKIKADGRLSFADLIKLGAGIAKSERQMKLADAGTLEAELIELRTSVQIEEERLAETIKKKREEKLASLSREIKAYRLFDSGWTVEEVSFKLSISDK